MASEIRVDKINSLSGVGTVTLSPTGVDIAGITTAATLRATTGIVTSLTAGSLTSLGAVSGTTGTFSAAVSGTTGSFSDTLSITDNIQHTGDTNTQIRFPSADTITAETGGSERLRIDSNGLIANNARVPSSFGSPNLLISGTDSTLTLMGDGSSNNSSFTGIKFRVAGASTGDYTKAGIFAQRQGGYNDLDLIFALDTVADATSVAIADEKMRITSSGDLGLGTASPSDNIHIAESGATNNYIRFSNSNISNGWSVGAQSGGRFQIVQNGVADRFFIESDGNVTVNSGNLIIGTSGKGIDFSATADAGSPSSSTSELFDDYEEGTWVPGLSGSDGITGQTYHSRNGFYTKIGNRVYCDFSFVINAKGSYSGTYIQLVNLPFPINGSSYTRSNCTPIYYRTLNNRWCFLGLQGHEGQSKCYVFGVEGPGSGADGASNRSYPDGSDIANSTEMTGSFSYLTS